MKKLNSSRKIIHHSRYLILGIFAVIFGSAGTVLLKISLADYDHSPVGYIDYCQLENNRTALYGWAADPDVGAGPSPTVTVRISNGQTLTANTDISGYRDGEINLFLRDRGMPTSGIYGFKIDLGTLYKGQSYGVNGTINNVGQGASSTLIVNDFRNVDGKPNFPAKNIPDVCLGTLQVTQPAPTRPIPTRRPAPAPAPTAAPPVLSTNADGIVTTGSLATALQIPNGNAEKIRIAYGKVEQSLDLASETVGVSPDTTTILLTKLEPVTKYYYQIIRLKNDDTAATSAAATFETQGLDVFLTFKNGDQAVAGITTEIASSGASATTDDEGSATLKQIPLGVHDLTFKHDGKDYTRQIDVNVEGVNAEALENPIVAVIPTNIQLEDYAISAGEPVNEGGGKLWIILVILLILGAIAGVAFWFIKRRRSMASNYDYSIDPANLTAAPQQPTQPTIMAPPYSPGSNGQPPAAHSGESLKDLVIQSMREDAARKQAEKNKNDLPPQAP